MNSLMAEYNLPGSPVFIDEPIDVIHLNAPLHEKSPGCPNGFVWRGEAFEVEALLSEWKDFSRRGRLARNMRPAHHERALLTGSLGSGRFFFRVRTRGGRVFDLYYDRAIKDALNKSGRWVLFREFLQEE